MSDIINITPAAIEHIKRQIAEQGHGIGFRLSIKSTGCNGYMYVPEIIDDVNPDDLMIETDLNLKLFIDSKIIDKIKGTKIDYVKKNLGVQMLEYDNPNASGLCGCGESFNLEDHG